MTPEGVMDVMMRAMTVTLEVAGPLLGVGLVIGLLMGLVQAATQLSEPAIGFVPKILAMGGTLVFMGGWLLERLTSFGREMLGAIGQIQP
jgi:flagellar biosynthetic protein FliQ